MKHYAWNAEKNDLLKVKRGISFQDVVFHIGAGDVMDILSIQAVTCIDLQADIICMLAGDDVFVE